MNLSPGDEVVWFRVVRGSTYRCQRIPATVYGKAKSKIAIFIQGKEGREVRYVKEDQLEKVRTECVPRFTP